MPTHGRVMTNGDSKLAIEQGIRIERGTTRIWEHQREMVRLLVAGWRVVDIAKHLGVTPQTVTNTKNSPIIQRQIAIMQGAADAEALDVAIEIKNMAPRALEVLSDLMENSLKDTVRANCAIDILDRAGYGAPKKIEAVVAHLTADEISEMRARMHEAMTEEAINDK